MSSTVPPGEREAINALLERLIAIWQDLDQGNREFMNGESSLERFLPLLDRREVAFESSRQQEADLLERLNRLDLPGRPFDMAGAWKMLPEVFPVFAPTLTRSRKVLQALVESDRAVELRLQVGRENLRAQIREARRGAHLLKGYTQADPMGSCFIDKVR